MLPGSPLARKHGSLGQYAGSRAGTAPAVHARNRQLAEQEQRVVRHSTADSSCVGGRDGGGNDLPAAS